MSDTPRTDFQAGWAVSDGGVVKAEYLYADTKGVFVHAAFARELERELARLTLCHAELLTIIDNDGYPSGADYAKIERELAEQVLCNGKGAEREAGLLGKIERLERENARLREVLKSAKQYIAKVNSDYPPGMDDERDEIVGRIDSALPNA